MSVKRKIDGAQTLLIGESTNGDFGFVQWFDGSRKKIKYLSINQYENDNRFYLFFLDEHLETLQDYLEESIVETKQLASQLFPNENICWVPAEKILEKIEKYKGVKERILVDLDNERPYHSDIVGLARNNEVTDFQGNSIILQGGEYVYLYTESPPDYIFAEGVVIPNPYEDLSYKWCCSLVGEIEYFEDYNKRFGR
jgi:hypothetical protein